MAYVTQSDVEPGRLKHQELIELTDDAGTGEVDTAVLQQALDEASADVDSYCAGRYTLPLNGSAQVKAHTLNIAVYKLFMRRRRISEEVRTAREDTIRFLKDVSAGKASLDQAAAKQTSEMDVVTKDHATEPDKFGKENLEGF